MDDPPAWSKMEKRKRALEQHKRQLDDTKSGSKSETAEADSGGRQMEMMQEVVSTTHC
jgi:hypothetical protein